MLPKNHIFIGALATLLIYLIYPQIGIIAAVIIFLSSVLIDVDHYLYFILKKKKLSLRRAYLWFMNHRNIFLKLSNKEREKFERAIMLFHGIECWILIILLIFVNKVFLFILLGVGIHMVLDFIDLYITDNPLYIKTSQIYLYLQNKNKKRLN